MMDIEQEEFQPPPEAPVFEPTDEEFVDPLAYIAKIRPIAEKAGICKIKPPPHWQPPFAVDVDKFVFTPRVQRLNELEAQSRVKLNFLDHLAKFWELQGVRLRIPNVERKHLDLYRLFKIVHEEGGYEEVTRERKWTKVANRMNYPNGKGTNSVLRTHYERILYPYDIFQMGATLDPSELAKEGWATVKDGEKWKLKKEDDDKDYVPGGMKQSPGGSRKSKRIQKDDQDVDYSANNEMRKLQYYGAGPKAAVPQAYKDEDDPLQPITPTKSVNTRKRRPLVDHYHCHICKKGDSEDQMLLCDGCDDAFHTFCLIPPLPEVPKGDWRCPKCVAKECSKPLDPYGFEQAKKEYSLQSFGEMADQFKADYFNMPVHMVPYSMAEKEFWRLVNCLEEDVCVEYGADIHASDCGSGFPTKESKTLFRDDEVEDYVDAKWNLNNLPVLEQSVLCHINSDINGMKIPWCYVGMCFSSFCWHNEDHWSYSINYLHWGEPKTWYGVPGFLAPEFEAAMKATAPELFEQQPDLLHQLTTIMNPNVLMKHGVPVVRTNQLAGEFVVTFPRAYHAGFNQGYNFAEAVNFCPADWLPIGRGCIDHYSELRRHCVFSHEELVCKMAADPDSLDLNLAASTHADMLALVDREKKLRKSLLDRGTVEAEREAFELLPDDERQCDFCRTTCFLSAVTCSCSPNKLVCMKHVDKLCKCHPSQHCLRYRYTLDELPTMLHRLKVRAESFDNWAIKVKKALEADGNCKQELQCLKDLVVEAEEKKFPPSDLLGTLTAAITDAEKCASVANQLVGRKVRTSTSTIGTRNRQSGDTKYTAKLSLNELECFIEQVDDLPCIIKEGALIKDLLQRVIDFQNEAREALEEETPDSEKLERLVDFGVTLDVDLPEIPKLKQVLQQAHWLDEVRNTLAEPGTVTLDDMRKLLDSGVSLAPHTAVEKAMAELQELLTISERWEERARICLQARPRHVLATLEAIINESKGIPAYLPNVEALKDALKKAKEWTSKVDSVQNGELYPYLDVLENLVNKGRPIPVRLDQLPQVESQVAAAKSWRERTARTFLKKNSTYSLVEVLSPRGDIGVYSSSKYKKRKMKEGEREKENLIAACILDIKVEEQRDPMAMVNAFKQAEHTEVESMRELRSRNMEKHRNHEDGDVKYCICRKGASGFMLQCELCKDWFHSQCVPLPKSTNLKNKSSHAAIIQAARDLKFLCPLCLRSRRPRLETILSLLVSLQKLPVRLPEGEALQCLTERAMAWQDRARQALATEELASALAKLSVLSQKMVEQAAREKTEKIINAELLKAANNPELQGHLQTVTQSAFSGSGLPVQPSLIETPVPTPTSTLPVVPLSPIPAVVNQSSIIMDTETTPMQVDVPCEVQQEVEIPPPPLVSNAMSSEHAYSSASKPNPNASPRKHQRKSPLVPRQLETPVLELSDMAKAQLEELMMEGDLLEVSLDETQHIWRILQACQPRPEEKFMEFDDLEPDLLRDKNENKERKKKKRKMKYEEGEDGWRIKEEDGKPRKKKYKLKDGKERKLKAKLLGLALPGFGKKMKMKDKKNKDKDGKKKKKKLKIKHEKDEKLREKLKEKKRLKKKKKLAAAMGGEEKSEEDCAAVNCLKPIGEEVNWVQCDKCELWFHLLCVGLAENEISENEDYVCFSCRYKEDPNALPFSLDRIKKEIDEWPTNSQNGSLQRQTKPKTIFGVQIKTEPVDNIFDLMMSPEKSPKQKDMSPSQVKLNLEQVLMNKENKKAKLTGVKVTPGEAAGKSVTPPVERMLFQSRTSTTPDLEAAAETVIPYSEFIAQNVEGQTKGSASASGKVVKTKKVESASVVPPSGTADETVPEPMEVGGGASVDTETPDAAPLLEKVADLEKAPDHWTPDLAVDSLGDQAPQLEKVEEIPTSENIIEEIVTEEVVDFAPDLSENVVADFSTEVVTSDPLELGLAQTSEVTSLDEKVQEGKSNE
ncbi:lysine-specific demethylase 5A-like isoform X2 [Lineus longissimus]|uniref:lysine-specific demethylase 5A-like isoform X2 n=1 Tax=Lineus longissimus TaxID=88925 RepID=UPI00315D5AD9